MEKPALFVLTTDELNTLGTLVKKLTLGDGLLIWQMLLSIAQNNGADKVLASYTLPEDPKDKKPKK